MREAHVPAEHPEAQEAPRLPGPHADPRRSSGAQGPSPARPGAPVGLTWRVRDRATFAAFAGAERHTRGPVTVRFVAGGGSTPPRVAYSAAGARNAVARNRLRRRLRAAVARAEGHLVPGGAYLVTARREALTVPFDVLVDTLSELFGAAAERR